MTTRAAGYVRVSTVEQVRDGWNLEEDKQRIRERSEAEGWELVDLFDDGGRQGEDLERPGLRALLATVEAGGVDVVILRDLDRLTRDRYIYALAVRTFETAGVQVYEFDKAQPVVFDLATDVRAAVAQDEKRKIGVRVKLAQSARRRAGLVAGGPANYGYRWWSENDADVARLIVVPERARVIERIFTEFVAGRSQRSLAHALNAEGVPTTKGGPWLQSTIARILRHPIYVGKLPGDDGELRDGKHEPIISEDLWQSAQAILTGQQRKAGRRVHGEHLLVRGMLKCPCGASMVARKAIESPRKAPESYRCGARFEHGPGACTQPGIHRDKIDGPFLAAILDGYLDLTETRRRVEARMTTALTRARSIVAERQAGAARIENALATTERDYTAGDLTGKQYSAREARLSADLEGARNALTRAQEHLQQVETSGPMGDAEGALRPMGDAEGALLEHLAALKAAVSGGIGGAPDLLALRNTIAQMFERVQLVRAGEWPRADLGDGMIPWHDDVPTVADGEARYWLLPVLRQSAVDPDTLEPIRAVLPVFDAQLEPSISPHT